MRRYARLIALTILTALMLWRICAVSARSAGILPDAVQYKNARGPAIMFEDIEWLSVENVQISAQSVSQGMVSSPVSGVAVRSNIVFTDEKYPMLHNIRLIEGSFWGDAAGESGSVAVIGETTAVKLYMTTDAVGLQISVNGSVLTVAGVYAVDKSFVSEISADGLESVFVPYSSAIQGTPDRAGEIYMREAGANGIRRPAIELYQHINSLLGGALDNYAQKDYFFESRILAQMSNVAMFILGLAVIVLLVRVAVRVLMQMRNAASSASGARENARARLHVRSGILVALLIAAAVSVFLLIQFDLTVPSSRFPPDGNVFDFGFYYNAIVNSFQAKNLAAADYYGNVAFYGFWLLAAHTVVLAVLTFAWACAIDKVRFKPFSSD